MADSSSPPPTKPKPGSLRDRIAAFEKPASSTAAPPKPPPVRPKPGGLAWKPAPPSPTEKNDESEETKKPASGAMSATDAKDSIRSGGGSLKERMAALQGLGGFGGGAPAAPPVPGPKPMKRPPLVVPPPPEEPEEASEEPQAETKHADEPEKSDIVSSESAEPVEKEETAEEVDEATKERERRAAIAARMARLGGARVGMAPPVLGPKPVIKPKPAPPSVPHEEQLTQPGVGSQVSSADNAADTEAGQVEKGGIREEVSSAITKPIEPTLSASPPLDDLTTAATQVSSPPVSEVSASSHSPPTSIPLPSVPRRAAPPRKKRPEPKKQESDPSVSTSEVVSSPIEGGEQPSAAEAEPSSVAETKQDAHEAEESKVEEKERALEHDELVQEDDIVHDHVAESPEAKREHDNEEEEVVGEGLDGSKSSEAPVAEERSLSPVIAEDAEPVTAVEYDEEAEPAAVVEQEDDSVIQASTVPPEDDEHASPSGEDNDNEQDLEAVVARPPPIRTRSTDTHEAIQVPVESEPAPDPEEEPDTQPEPVSHELAQVDEEEDEEEARKRRIAEKVAKMGGRNPFAAAAGAAMPPPPPPPRRTSGPSRTTSKDEAGVLSEGHEPPTANEDVSDTGGGAETSYAEPAATHHLGAGIQPEGAGEDEDEEEGARKRRIAERIAKMGGRNPFSVAPVPTSPEQVDAPPPLPRRTSSTSNQAQAVERTVGDDVKDYDEPADPAVEEGLNDGDNEVDYYSQDVDKTPTQDEGQDETSILDDKDEALDLDNRDPPEFVGITSQDEHEAECENVHAFNEDVDEYQVEVGSPLEEEPEAEIESSLPSPPPPPPARTVPRTLATEEVNPVEATYGTVSEQSQRADESDQGEEFGEDQMPPARILRSIPPIPSLAKRSTDSASDTSKSPVRSPLAERAVSPRRALPPPPPPPPPEHEDLDEQDELAMEQVEEPEEIEVEEEPITDQQDVPPPPPPPRPVHTRESTNLSTRSSDSARLPSPPRASVPSPPLRDDFAPEARSPSSPPPPPPPSRTSVSLTPTPVRQPTLPPPVPSGRPPIPQIRTSPHQQAAHTPPASRRSMPPPRLPLQGHPQATTRSRVSESSEDRAFSPVESISSPPSLPARTVDRPSIEEMELLPDSEPDPVDPSLPSPRSPAIRSPIMSLPLPPPPPSQDIPPDVQQGDEDQARRRTIAERMAKLGGIKFGAPPPRPPPKRPTPRTASHDEGDGIEAVLSETTEKAADHEEEEQLPEEPTSEEAERARRQAIAARLAGMGGMRFGMMPGAAAHPRGASGSSMKSVDEAAPPPPPQRPGLPSQAEHLARPPRPPARQEEDKGSGSEDGVKVDAPTGSETSIEEVTAEDAEEEPEEILPPRPPPREHHPSPAMEAVPSPPARTGRPPVPALAFERQPSAGHVSPSNNDFVMINDGEDVFAAPPPPPPPARTSRPSHGTSNPPSLAPSKDSSGAPWELPSIPSGSFSLSVGASFAMDSSVTSEDSTTYPAGTSSGDVARDPVTAPHAARSPVAAVAAAAPGPVRPVSKAPPSAEELTHLGNTLGKAVQKAAAALLDRSKKNIVGDGTSRGFVDVVLAQVPQASRSSFGHLIYAQTGNTVTRRSSAIMPGDIVEFVDAKLKGHRGLQSYHQSAGTSEVPLVAVIGEFDTKKSKIKVFQANQHVGSQTVESVSYRLDDMKSGSAKIFRVASI